MKLRCGRPLGRPRRAELEAPGLCPAAEGRSSRRRAVKKNPVEISDFDRPCRAKDFLGERRKIISRRALLAEQYLIPPPTTPTRPKAEPPEGGGRERSERKNFSEREQNKTSKPNRLCGLAVYTIKKK